MRETGFMFCTCTRLTNIQMLTCDLLSYLMESGAGDDSYFGSGTWISPSIDDIEQRWCAEIFDRPIGAPAGKAVKTGERSSIFPSLLCSCFTLGGGVY